LIGQWPGQGGIGAQQIHRYCDLLLFESGRALDRGLLPATRGDAGKSTDKLGQFRSCQRVNASVKCGQRGVEATTSEAGCAARGVALRTVQTTRADHQKKICNFFRVMMPSGKNRGTI